MIYLFVGIGEEYFAFKSERWPSVLAQDEGDLPRHHGHGWRVGARKVTAGRRSDGGASPQRRNPRCRKSFCLRDPLLSQGSRFSSRDSLHSSGVGFSPGRSPVTAQPDLSVDGGGISQDFL